MPEELANQVSLIRRRVFDAISSAECPDKQPDPPFASPFLLHVTNPDPERGRKVQDQEEKNRKGKWHKLINRNSIMHSNRSNYRKSSTGQVWIALDMVPPILPRHDVHRGE